MERVAVCCSRGGRQDLNKDAVLSVNEDRAVAGGVAEMTEMMGVV